ncbi:MAG: hypothetical protein ACE5HE_09175 [Phycisphaerae bacterium]
MSEKPRRSAPVVTISPTAYAGLQYLAGRGARSLKAQIGVLVTQALEAIQVDPDTLERVDAVPRPISTGTATAPPTGDGGQQDAAE